MSTVKFTVANELQSATGQGILVFPDATISSSSASDPAVQDTSLQKRFPWRTLKPGPGGQEPFSYTGVIELVVTGPAGVQSAKITTTPGTSYEAYNEKGQGPELRPISALAGAPNGSVSVVNHMSPPAMLSAKWFVDGHPVMAHRGLNEDASSDFLLGACLFFKVVSLDGAPSFDGATEYVTPQGTTAVSVTWSRPQGPSGPDVLTFAPLSSESQRQLQEWKPKTMPIQHNQGNPNPNANAGAFVETALAEVTSPEPRARVLVEAQVAAAFDLAISIRPSPASISARESALRQLGEPVGKYTKVVVVDPLTGGTLLNGGTGTMNESQMFSCGNFAGDFPKVNQRYKITALDPKGNAVILVLFCTASGQQTCDFKETAQALKGNVERRHAAR